ncbi:DMT family transporter [Frankia sp. QA3]|uniref:DMT family transporter n=1 Tax=Frankia sp. QA3 TaxID=710111 RepID=UPI000269C922|nr:DMT family transporter [Frankia sp. QA3]EIV94632.1 putative membrane protein [Frankia sp. QA3]
MSKALALGLPTAVVSAALYGVAPLVQARAARREEESSGLGLGLLARLVLRPLWLLGLAVEAASFLLEVYALSVAPVAMVAPVMALDMIIFTLLAQRVLGERISLTGWLGVGSMVAGVGLLAYAFARRAEVGTAASTDVLLAFLVLGLIFALVCAFFANVAAVRNMIAGAAFGFGAAAGVCYAIATLATRQIGLAVNDRREGQSALADLLTTPTPYVLVLFSVLALGLQQRGLQGRAAVIAFPVTSGVSAFLPVTLGLTLFGEPAPDGAHRVAFVVAMVMVAAGIAALGRDRMAANRSVDELEGAAVRPDRLDSERVDPDRVDPDRADSDRLDLKRVDSERSERVDSDLGRRPHHGGDPWNPPGRGDGGQSAALRELG